MATGAALDDIVTIISPDLKARGFKKSRLVWKRHHGKVEQVLVMSEASGGEVELDVGFVFDEVAKLRPDTTGSVIIGRVTTHVSMPLATLAGVKKKRSTRSASGVPGMVAKGIEVLDRVDSAAHALAELELDRGFDKAVRAQLHWVTGNQNKALADLAAVAKEFSDRRGVSVPELAWRHLRHRIAAKVASGRSPARRRRPGG